MPDTTSTTGPVDEHSRPARLVDLHRSSGQVTVLLATARRDVPLTLALTDDAAHALAHLAALHGHDHGCGASLGADVHVGLLLRTLRAVGCTRPLLLVRAYPSPAFWLHGRGVPGLEQLPLDVLDALVLLVAGHVDVGIVDAGEDRWDATFDRLLDHAPRP